MRTYLKDSTLSTFSAGLISVIVGYTSSAILVYEAATVSGATPAEASSWLGIICLAMGTLSIMQSLQKRIPIMFAWSTTGAALLISSAGQFSLNEVIGSFVVSAFMITISGYTGVFEKIMNRIPMSLSSAMLAGVLVQFAFDVFRSMKTELWAGLTLFITYLLARKLAPRLAIMYVLLTGILVYSMNGKFIVPQIENIFVIPAFIMPAFSWASVISLAIPLFVVTMTSQNLTGVTVLRSFGYYPKISPLIGISGFTNLITAPFGCFTLNLSALTAAICMGPDSHVDKDKRYTAAVTSGIIYIIIGLFSGAVAFFFSAFPKELTMALAGIALFGTIGSSMTHALGDDESKESALITFFITASGISFIGIGAAFWGLVGGAVSLLIRKISIKRRGL